MPETPRPLVDTGGGPSVAAAIADWCETDHGPGPTVRLGPREAFRAGVRRRTASLAWWIERRPALGRALGELDLSTVLQLVVRPHLAGLRSNLRSPFSGLAPRAVRRFLGRAPRGRGPTPAGFPQDTDGRVTVIASLPRIGSRRFRRLVHRARDAGVVRLDRGALDSPAATAAVMTLARAGAPLRVVGVRAVVDAVPAAAWSALCSPFDPLDDRERELHSIRVRRAAWSSVVPVGSVSVLLATRRPEDLPAAVEMVIAQRGVDVQLCLGLHGMHWPADTEARLRSRVGDSLVVERFDEDVDLGRILDELACRADGELLAKWDDDDVYGPDHLLDLVLAHHYSRAEIVGKAAEFVYLESIDTTVRRFVTGAERPSTTLAGGTLLLESAHLAAIGGWPHGPRRVDGLLIDEILRRGGSTYRTHGFQYILRRRPPGAAGGHTWSTPDDYFLLDAVDQRPSLALAFADVGRIREPAQ